MAPARRSAGAPATLPSWMSTRPDPAADESAAVGGLDATAVRRSWDAVLAAIWPKKRTTEALLLNAQVLDVQDEVRPRALRPLGGLGDAGPLVFGRGPDVDFQLGGGEGAVREGEGRRAGEEGDGDGCEIAPHGDGSVWPARDPSVA